MFKDLNDIRLFAQVARQGAVTRGAAALGVPVATVSRRLAALEREVDMRLIERHSRRFELTEAGRAYYVAAARVLEDIELATAEMSNLAERPSGHLRIAAPSDFATFFMAPAITAFASRYPDITVSLDLSSRRVSLIDEGFDLAVRMGALTDSQLVSRRLLTLTRSLYASPAYTERAPLPRKPQEVQRCRLVTLEAYTSYGELTLQRVTKPGVKETVPVEGHIRVNSMTMLRQLLLAGAGIGLVPDLLMADELREGRAVRVLPAWQAPGVEAHVLYRSRALLPQRVRLFVDHLLQTLDGTGLPKPVEPRSRSR